MDGATFFSDIGAEVEIPPDGTLSRMLFKSDRLRVVVFAFDAGQELTDHTAPVPALIQVISGRLRLRLGDEDVVAETGSWIHMPGGLPHAVHALEPSVMLLTMLRGA